MSTGGTNNRDIIKIRIDRITVALVMILSGMSRIGPEHITPSSWITEMMEVGIVDYDDNDELKYVELSKLHSEIYVSMRPDVIRRINKHIVDIDTWVKSIILNKAIETLGNDLEFECMCGCSKTLIMSKQQRRSIKNKEGILLVETDHEEPRWIARARWDMQRKTK